MQLPCLVVTCSGERKFSPCTAGSVITWRSINAISRWLLCNSHVGLERDTSFTWKEQCTKKQRMAAYEQETLTESNSGARKKGNKSLWLALTTITDKIAILYTERLAYQGKAPQINCATYHMSLDKLIAS